MWPRLLNGSPCTTTARAPKKISTNEYKQCQHKMSPYSRSGGHVVRYTINKGKVLDCFP